MSSIELFNRVSVGAYRETPGERAGRFAFRYILSGGKVRA